MRSLRFLAALAAATLLVAVTSAAGLSATGGSSSSVPRWWPKYQALLAGNSAPGGGGNVKAGANVDLSNEAGPQSETSIAINPANPKQVVAGSNEIFRLPMRGYFSNDGGKSWGAVDLPLPPPLNANQQRFGSDPGVAWDTRGNVYYSYIVVFFSPTFGAVTGTEMAVARSTDGGQTWTPTYFNFTSGNSTFNDKPMIAVDDNVASAHRDTVYVGWDTAVTGTSGQRDLLLSSHSTDGGVSFSSPVAVSPGGSKAAVIGADPFVSPDGTLHIAWHDVIANAVMVASSTDGGATFGPQSEVAPTSAAFDVGLPAMASRRALVYPACGADASTGPARGTLYCSWMDETAANGADVFVARSTDGSTWSAPARVNDDPAGVANDQFNQWLAVDPADGSVVLSWNDSRNDPNHVATDIYFARSTNAAHTFAPNVKVTTAPTDESCCGADLGNQYGDYEGISALGGVARPVWTDRRASVAAVSGLDEEVFSAGVSY